MWRDVLGVFLVQVAWVILAHSLDGDKQLRELGFETCLDAFVVHKDKIIRTQDSTEMGAKFLTEVEVEVRFDCMRWCCETPHCDVFIFEEKKPGSCYLFHCGPPNDFKCKFTSHANYSSAVLRSDNMQNADALEEQIRRNQQEHELKSLRKMDSPSREREYDFYTNPPAPRLTDPPPTPSTTTTTLAPVKVPICSRNQFECRSNYDCIAIYNVCDGIPQCPDGSDEAAELGCPGDKTTQPPPPPPPPPVVASPKPPYVPLLPDVIRYQQQMMEQSQQQHAQYPMMYGHGQEVNKNWETNQLRPQESGGYRSGVYVPQQPQQQQSQDDLQQQQQPLPVNNYKPAPYNQWNNNYQGQAIYEQQSKIGNGAVLDYMHDPRNLVYAPSAYEQEQPPHIFNHKVPGGMRLDEMESQNGMYGGQDPNRVYAPYYSGMIHRDSWQEPPPPPPGPGPAGIPTQAPPTTTTLAPTTPPPCDPAEKNAEAIKTRSSSSSEDKRPNESVEAHPSQQQQHPAQAKAKDNKPALHESKPLPEKLKAESHKARDPAAEQPHSHISITDHVRRVPVVHEDSMSRPKGAVISLALGLSVTAVMAILIACRLRVVKRRGGRRGHDSYAHDADYLVNGMYL